jgi:hypothetical protein
VTLDNSETVVRFCPETDDGDTFIYTEMLDRSKAKGNNGHRLVKTFYHRSVEEFRSQMPVIRQLCDLAGVRACTRLSPRSYARVGRQFVRMVVEAGLTDNWAGMKSLYNRACGTTTPNQKLWLFDVDVIDRVTADFGDNLMDRGVLVATIPSKKGLHYVTRPHEYGVFPPGVSLHKDNPTNLYIPDGAA